LWGKVLVWFSSIESKYDYLVRNQRCSPQAGRAFTFFLQQKKVNIPIVIGPPPLKNKKLKTEYVSLKISKHLPLVVKQGNFLNAHSFCSFNAFSS